MNLFESVVDNISQGSTRRGRFSPYLPVEHPDIMEFLEIGTEGFPIQDLTHAVTVTDEFMNEMIAGDEKKRANWQREENDKKGGEMSPFFPRRYTIFKETQ